MESESELDHPEGGNQLSFVLCIDIMNEIIMVETKRTETISLKNYYNLPERS